MLLTYSKTQFIFRVLINYILFGIKSIFYLNLKSSIKRTYLSNYISIYFNTILELNSYINFLLFPL